MKYNFIILVTVCLMNTSWLFSQNLEHFLELEKNRYLKGEPIIILSGIQNLSTSLVKIYGYRIFDGCSKVKVEVRDEKGNLIPATCNINSDPCVGSYKLEGNESFVDAILLSAFYGNALRKNELTIDQSNFFYPGKYSVTSTYTYIDSTTSDIKPPLKTLRSKSLEFEVVEPVDEIDLLAYKALQKANSVLNDSTISYTIQKNLYIDQKKKNDCRISKQPIRSYCLPAAFNGTLLQKE